MVKESDEVRAKSYKKKSVSLLLLYDVSDHQRTCVATKLKRCRITRHLVE